MAFFPRNSAGRYRHQQHPLLTTLPLSRAILKVFTSRCRAPCEAEGDPGRAAAFRLDLPLLRACREISWMTSAPLLQGASPRGMQLHQRPARSLAPLTPLLTPAPRHSQGRAAEGAGSVPGLDARPGPNAPWVRHERSQQEECCLWNPAPSSVSLPSLCSGEETMS